MKSGKRGAIAFAILLAPTGTVAPILAQVAPSPPPAVSKSAAPKAAPGDFFALLEPFLSTEEFEELRRIPIVVPDDPVPAGHPCRTPSQFGYAEAFGQSERIVLCMRNLALFTMYIGEISFLAFLKQSFYKDEYAFEYAEVYANAGRRHADRPLDPRTQAPCHFVQYVVVRNGGGDGSECERIRPDGFQGEKWIADHPEAIDLERMDRVASQFGLSRAEVIRRLPKLAMQGNLVRAMLFTLLHEAGHVRLDHLKSASSGCAAVLEEHDADGFARAILGKVMPEPDDVLVDLDLFWLIYHLGAVRHTTALGERERLLEVRFLATMAAMWDRIERNIDKPGFRRFVEIFAPRPLEKKDVTDARRKMAEARTCLDRRRR